MVCMHPMSRVFHIAGPPKCENTPHVALAGARAAKRLIFSLIPLDQARAVDNRTYQVCRLTPSSRGAIMSQSKHKIMKNQ